MNSTRSQSRPDAARVPLIVAATLSALSLSACSSDDDSGTTPMQDTGPLSTLNTIDFTAGEDNIVALPASADDRIEAVFDRYTAFTAPNGSRVHFLSQDAVSDDILIRTRGLVRQHFFDVPGTTLGADKTSAFNRAAARGATFVLHENAASYDSANADVAAFQTLFGDRLGSLDASTIVDEASTTYLQPSPAFDPSIGATARFAFTQGISGGTAGFQTALDAATANAITGGIYTVPMGVDPEDEDDEYLAVALATYYGLFGHDPNSDGTSGLSGEYDVLDRTEMATADPMMFALIEDFFRPTHRYSAFLDSSFNGDFETTFDVAVPYTYRSQYLERVGIRTPSTARLNGNELSNILLGNVNSTLFEGAGGDDFLEGEGGTTDTAVFTGAQAEYTITDLGNNVTEVADTVASRDGTDQLRGIERIMFSDATIDL